MARTLGPRLTPGLLAVFGEAGMFSAQSAVIEGVPRQVGMNVPEADQNARFVLNLVHWLLGVLDPA